MDKTSSFQVGLATPLPSDPTLLHAIVVAICLPFIWRERSNEATSKQSNEAASHENDTTSNQSAAPEAMNKNGQRVARVLQFVGILILAYGQVNLYRVPFAITLSLCIIAVQNFISTS